MPWEKNIEFSRDETMKCDARMRGVGSGGRGELKVALNEEGRNGREKIPEVKYCCR